MNFQLLGDTPFLAVLKERMHPMSGMIYQPRERPQHSHRDPKLLTDTLEWNMGPEKRLYYCIYSFRRLGYSRKTDISETSRLNLDRHEAL